MNETAQKPTWAALAEDPQLKERRTKLSRIVQVQMMEFKVNSPDKLAVCVTRLLNMFRNILTNPNDEKYRKIKANNAKFKNDVLDAAKQTEEFLLAAGWHTRVEQMERYWVFDGPQDSIAWKYLQLAHHELQAAQATIQDKAARHARELEEKKHGPQKQRELLLQQLEADKLTRKDRFRLIVSGPHNLAAPAAEDTAAAAAAASPPQAGAPGQPSPHSSPS